MKTQIEKRAPTREVHFDGFKQWFTFEGPETGHNVGVLWTYNDKGERVRVEIHLNSKDTLPISAKYGDRVAECRRILQAAYKELMEKVNDISSNSKVER